MKMRKSLCRVVVSAALLVSAGSAGVWAQKTAVPSRVVETVDDTQTVRLQGNVHPLARPAFDQGPVAESQPMTHMLLVLQRSQTQELALRQLLDAQLTKNSGSYHAWLSPEQFGQQFGPSDADVQAVTDWLTGHGFQVRQVAKGKTVVEFDGNAGQVRNAFHTEIHRFVVNGKEHFANVTDPAIPEALAPVVAGVAALHNFPKQSYVRRRGAYTRNKETGKVEPLFTTTGQPATYAVGPGDWNKIYNVPTATATGAGQTIAIVADSNINTNDVVNFRSMFSLPAYSSVCPDATLPTTCPLAVVVNGPDPGIVPPPIGDEDEADLDVEWAGALAPNAQIILVVSEGTQSNPTQVSQGVDLSALYIVDNNVGSVLSESFGACEPSLGTTGNQFYNSLWEQAAAQGITVSISAGDTGPAGCDPQLASDATEPAATLGLAVNGIASTPFNVAVGGTDFDPTTTNGNASTYWNTTPGTVNSALSYIPETTWDDSTCALNYPTACTTVDTTSGLQYDLSAGAGGPSNCATLNSAGTACVQGYAKPPWQQGGITPDDSARDLPDVSFFASNGGPVDAGTGMYSGAALVVCESDALPTGVTSCDLSSPYQNFSLVGGTSAATPAFAAVMALVDQAIGQRQGNANYVLYELAAQDTTNYMAGKCASSVGQTPASTCVYNDVTKGNDAVACVLGSDSIVTGQTSWCAGSGSTYGVTVTSTGIAFPAGAEYDYATGLGSINVTHLLAKWTTATRTATTTTIPSVSGGSPTGTTFTANVSVSSVSGTPTGDVSLIALFSDQVTVLGSFGPFTLSGGTATVTTTLLPVNTAYVEATYGGDATHAVSASLPTPLSAAVTGADYTSNVTAYFVSFNSTTGAPVLTTSAQNFPYGTPYILEIVVASAQKNASCAFSYPNTTPPFPCPTGTITLTANGNPQNDFLKNGTATNVTNLNNLGLAEDQTINLSATAAGTSPGKYSVVAAYSGDPNYSSGTSNTLSITIQKATPAGVAVGTSLSTITPGASVTITAYVVTNSNGGGPTGTMQFTVGSSSVGSATCQPTSGQANITPPITAISAGTGYCVATLTTTSITGLHPTPTGKPGMPAIPRVPAIVALLSLLLFLLGLRFVPQTRRRIYTYVGLLAIALLVGVVAGCGGGSSSTSPPTGTFTITAAYPGDANYNSSSGTAQIIVQ